MYCQKCNKYIDLDFDSEHFEEDAMEEMLEMGLTEEEAERQLEDYLK